MVADEKNEILSDVKTEILSSEKTEIISISSTPQEGSSGMDKLEDFFAIKSKVGDGGMGVVYLAKDIRLNRYVAIKRLKPQFLVDQQIRRRFLHEAKAVASLNNANIVHIYFIGEDNDGPYFVMEYIEGAVANLDNPNQPNPPQTLEQYIATNGVMSVDEAIDFMVKVGGAVVAAHSSGVIHRDLKPTNILIDISCFPKIVDFGLARITHTDVVASSLTVKGDKFISLGYGAPEQEQDASITDERADIYGLGGISYYILTGKNPRFFREDDLPENIRPVISKALATDREQRWPTAESFIAALVQCKSNSFVERPTVKTTWRCKWCDTINPFATRYCGSCGWDGGTVCPECGAPNHFGVMFCSTCGANCKEYERAQTALDEARSALASAQYERILTNNSKPLNFDPIGPNGRKLIEELNQIYIDAKKKKERRDELVEIISMEINAENYERAERFIVEFRSISASNEAYETELSEFSKLKQRRDLARVAKAFTLNDWEYGAKLLDTIKTSGGTANVVEQRRLESIYKKHQRRSHLRCYPIIGLSVLFVYILLLPIVVALLPSGFVRTVWYPANAIVKTLHLTDSVEQISQFMGGSVVATFKDEQILVETPKEAVAFQNYFDSRNKEFQLVYDEKVKTLEKEYIDVLETLSDQFKNELNMDAWILVRNEQKRFQSNPNEIVLLNVNTEAAHRAISLQKAHILKRDTTLAGVYHEYLTTINKKLETLDASIKKLMHDSSVAKNGGNEKDSERLMDDAEAYYKIRNTVKQNSFYVAATAALKSFDKKYPNLAGSFYLGDSSGEKTSQIVIEKRKAFENQMSEFASQRKAKEQERASAYVKALDDLLTKRKAAGDFDGVTIITKEQERFTQSQTIIVNSLSQDLNNLTKQFVERERLESNQIDKAILGYVDTYIAELDKLISDQTKANNLNVAAAIDSERKRVQILPEVVEIREQQQN